MSLNIAHNPNPNDYQIVPYIDPERQRRDRRASTVRNWPNPSSCMTALSVVVTAACWLTNTPYAETLLINAYRSYDVYHMSKEKNYAKVAFNIASYAALFFPYGKVGSILIDLAYEAFNYYRSEKRLDEIPFKLKRLDPKIQANALRIFTVPAERSQDLEFIKEQHRWRSEMLTGKLQSTRPKPSEFLITQLQYMLDDVNEAYQTLTAGLE